MTIVPGGATRSSQPSGLADVLDVVLDKGIVIDAFVRVAIVGIELLTVDAKVVIASVDTYLRYAEAMNRLEMQPRQPVGLPEMVKDVKQGQALSGVGQKLTQGGGLEKAMGELTKGGGLGKAIGALTGALGGEKEEEEEEEELEREREPRSADEKRRPARSRRPRRSSEAESEE